MMRGDIVDHRANPPDREAATAWGRGRPVHKMIQEPAFKAGFFRRRYPYRYPCKVTARYLIPHYIVTYRNHWWERKDSNLIYSQLACRAQHENGRQYPLCPIAVSVVGEVLTASLHTGRHACRWGCRLSLHLAGRIVEYTVRILTSPPLIQPTQ